MGNIDLEKFNIRTDLAFEALALHKITDSDDIKEEEYTIGNVNVRRTAVGKQAAKQIHKKPGIYYTVDSSAVETHDHDHLESVENALTEVIRDALKIEGITNKSKGLLVGLGNYNVTPDSLGPLVIDSVMVTRHMYILNPEGVSDGVSNVCALAPGVMGTTGIETYDIVAAVLEKIDIDYLIVIDALASRSVSRVNKTIQITNTGISPGSGVGNNRKELNKESLNIPVIAIGVPTVVDAVTITSDTIDMILKYLHQKITNAKEESNKLNVGVEKIDFQKTTYPPQEQVKQLFGEFGILDDYEKRSLIQEVLSPNGFNMMVTPKEIDMDIEDLSKVISRSIDRALHEIVG